MQNLHSYSRRLLGLSVNVVPYALPRDQGLQQMLLRQSNRYRNQNTPLTIKANTKDQISLSPSCYSENIPTKLVYWPVAPLALDESCTEVQYGLSIMHIINFPQESSQN